MALSVPPRGAAVDAEIRLVEENSHLKPLVVKRQVGRSESLRRNVCQRDDVSTALSRILKYEFLVSGG